MLRLCVAGRAGHGIDPGLVLREDDRVAQVRLAREHHHRPIDAPRNAAVRWRAHPQRVEEEFELCALLLCADPEQVEHARLDLRLVDSEGAAGELVPVAYEVVGERARRAGILVEALLPLRLRTCAGV